MGKMKRMRFCRTSFDSLFFQAVIIAAFAGSIYVLIRIFKVVFFDLPSDERWKGILVYTLFVLSLPMLVYLESTFWKGTIRLEESGIRSHGDNRLPREKIQYPASVEYQEIVDISILPLRKDSRGRYLRLARPIPYLCIRNKAGKCVRFSLHFMSRPTVRRLLEELQNRLGSADNQIPMDLDKLMRDFTNARWATKEGHS